LAVLLADATDSSPRLLFEDDAVVVDEVISDAAGDGLVRFIAGGGGDFAASTAASLAFLVRIRFTRSQIA
jgi:hypothetical protein